MKLFVTDGLRNLLQASASLSGLCQDLRDRAQQAASAGAADWALLKQAYTALSSAGHPAAAAPLSALCCGGGLVHAPAPARRGKPPELEAYLAALRRRLEQQRYDQMVADVTASERSAAAAREGGLHTYKQQISFGFHIVLMMAAFYAFGHVAATALTRNRTWHPLVGLLFMFGALVLETTLYVIRTTVPPKLHWEAAKRAQRTRAAAAAASPRAQEEQGRAGRERPRGGDSSVAAVVAAARPAVDGGSDEGGADSRDGSHKKDD